MTRIVCEELWKNPGHPGLIVVTGNSTIEKGELAMICGASLEAVDRIPGIAKECAFAVENSGRRDYGFVVVRPPKPEENKIGFGLFQTKEWWGKPANTPLIRNSAKYLVEYATTHPEINIRLNYPGIGYGALTKDEAGPALVDIPDNVTICYRAPFVRISIKEVYEQVVKCLERGSTSLALEYMYSLGCPRNDAIDQVRAVQKSLAEARNATSGTERQQSDSEDNGIQQGRFL